MSSIDGVVIILGPNASATWGVEWPSYPGLAVVVPEPLHPSHEHAIRYTEPYVKKFADGRARYMMRLTNLSSETAHLQLRWSSNM